MAKKDVDKRIEIVDALNKFQTSDTYDAGLNLFKILGYNTELENGKDDLSASDFIENFVSGNVENFNEEKAITKDWKNINIIFQLSDDSFNGQRSLFDSTINKDEFQSYLIFSLDLNGKEYSRTQLAQITREINKCFVMPILILIKYDDLLTVSVINRRRSKINENKDVLEKVTLIKDISIVKTHRAHIEILNDLCLSELSKTYVVNSFATLHKAWSEVLDTQALNKRFYNELSNWYFWAMKEVIYPNSDETKAKNSLFAEKNAVREHYAKNLIRLLTRLLFVWFIKEKDLIPDELFDENKIPEIITKFSPNYNSQRNDRTSIYYKSILQNLFFASLNQEQEKRQFRTEGQHKHILNLMRYEKYHIDSQKFVKTIEDKVPFMNGGLFECLDHYQEDENGNQIFYLEDGFTDDDKNVLSIPDFIFFAKDVKVDLSSEYDDKSKTAVKVNGLIRILRSYKFTITENTPVEEDIALDPELLGRVFENLLASYNPETESTARKQTGSFYTPRPIVEYMVDESLKAYLKTALLNSLSVEDRVKDNVVEDITKKLNDYISYNEIKPNFSDDEKDLILKAIDNCKILDPACGSGAFPMGILQKLVYLIHKIDPQNENWKLIQIGKILNDKTLSSKEKLELQRDVINVFDDNELDYGRKLYLIENCIHGIDIQPVATQISRLRFFISLIVDQKVDSSKKNFGIRPLPNLENRFVTANSLIGLNDETATLFSTEVEPLMEELQKVRHELFKAKTPRYKAELRQRDKDIRKQLEETLISLGFGSENAKHLSTWDPYNKNNSADFFDSEWMFGIKDGFDLIIGNPPYVQLQKDGGKLAKLYEDCNFKTYAKTGDIYCLFYENGFNLLKREGYLCFITSNKWMRAGYGEKLRDFFAKETNPKLLIDFAGVKVFESATVDTNILLSQKAINKKNTISCVTKDLSEDGISNLSDFVQQNSAICSFDTSESWVILSPIEQSIKNKIESVGVPLKEWDISINYGIKTGFNDAFIISKEKRDEILNNCATEEERLKTAELIRPILRGRDIKRYSYTFANLWLIYLPWHFPLQSDNSIQGASQKAENEFKKQYPSVYSHMLSYKKELSSRNKAETGIRYEWYALQRWGSNYWEDFFKPKILFQEIVQESQFMYDENINFFCNDTCRIITGKYLKFILGIMNSKLFFFAVKNYYGGGGLGKNGVRMKHTFFQNFCCPPHNDDLEKLVEEQLKTNIYINELDHKVYELYGLTEDEIKFIESQ